MSDYFKGVLIAPSGTSTALLQVGNAVLDSDKFNAKDKNGNTAAEDHRDHRLQIHIEYIIPAAFGVPVPGTTASFTGVTLPTVSAEGEVTGTFSVGGTASVAGIIQPGVAVNTSNQDYIAGSFDAIHYIVNNLPSTTP